jgi:hypothetical protein
MQGFEGKIKNPEVRSQESGVFLLNSEFWLLPSILHPLKAVAIPLDP